MVRPETDQFIELEAPEELLPGQNFYDQPPLNAILEAVSQSSGFGKEDLQALLTSVLRIGFDDEYWKIRDAKFRQIVITLKRTPPRDLDKLAAYNEAIFKGVVPRLSEYPFIEQYIQSKFDPAQYNHDGNWRPGGSKIIAPATTYAKWVTDKIRSERLLRMKGIEEVFPRDFGQTDSPLYSSGKGRQNRRWRILKASELVAEKRQT